MEARCSLKTLPYVEGNCGYDSRDRKKENTFLPLLACKKDISAHKLSFTFSGPETEVELILSRAGIFTYPDDVETWTVCPYHRSKLGLGWTHGCNTACRIPVEISKHSKSKGKLPKAERGIGKADSLLILHTTGVLVPVGSGM